MNTKKWCRKDNEKRRIKQQQMCDSLGLGGGKKISNNLGVRAFSIGANKRISFVADVKSITKFNNIFIKLQSSVHVMFTPNVVVLTRIANIARWNIFFQN